MTNLTPHAIHLHLVSGTVVTIPPSGIVARAKEISREVSAPGPLGVRVVTVAYGEIENVPPPKEGEVYLVSALVRLALPGRFDLFSPHDLVRDEAGAIVGCRALVMNSTEGAV